jgi:predicted phosphoribosyltransferase
LVDDGLATGLTMRAAIAAIRAENPGRLLVAVPVGAVETCEEIAQEVDALICPLQPEDFQAVGLWYRDFTATTDREVRECLAAGRMTSEAAHHAHATRD